MRKLRNWLVALNNGVLLAVAPLPPFSSASVTNSFSAVSNRPLILEWSYATNAINTNLVFLLRGSPNLTPSPLSWNIENLVNVTNWFSNNVCIAPIRDTNYVFSITNNVIPGSHFYTVSASNIFWEAESDFSNTLGLDPLPSQGSNLRAIKGW